MKSLVILILIIQLMFYDVKKKLPQNFYLKLKDLKEVLMRVCFCVTACMALVDYCVI